MTKKKVPIVINPSAGHGTSFTLASLEEDLQLHVSNVKLEPHYTKWPGHAQEISHELAKKGNDLVIAAGGDGTVNEVASGVLNTGTSMGIIPLGSGNGIARHFRIPEDPYLACSRILKGISHQMDTGKVNGKPFIGFMGVGFDAYIAEKASGISNKGFRGYIRTVLRSYFKYQAQHYDVLKDYKNCFSGKALFISIANTSQFGKGFTVAPQASADDGSLDLCVLKPFPILESIAVLRAFFRERIDHSSYYQGEKGREFMLRRRSAGPVNVDGEAIPMEKDLIVEVDPSSLRIQY